MLKLYGVKTCDSCRKARRWLDSAGIAYQYIDLRDDGIERTRVQGWLKAHGSKKLINKRSRTWRELDADAKAACEHEPLAQLLAHPTLIKRPVLETQDRSLVGFSAPGYETALAGSE